MSLPAKPALLKLSIPLSDEDFQQSSCNVCLDILQIRITNTIISFIQFCWDCSVQVMTVTWNKLNNIISRFKQLLKIQLSDLSEDEFLNILLSKENWRTTREQFPNKFHNFINKYYNLLCLNYLAGSDIEKFLKKKLIMLKEDILHTLPFWLSDLNKVFLS